MRTQELPVCSEMSKGKLPVLLSGESNIQDRSVDASLHPGATNLGGSARNPTGQTHRSAREPPPERLSSITSGVARGQLPPPTFAPLRPTEGEHSHQQIPPVQELTALNDRIHAPNLTTYIHHVHNYTFHGSCTIYQGAEAAPDGKPAIFAEPGTYGYSHTERRWAPGRDSQDLKSGAARTAPVPRESQQSARTRFDAPMQESPIHVPATTHTFGRTTDSVPVAPMKQASSSISMREREASAGPSVATSLGMRTWSDYRPASHTSGPPSKRRARAASVPRGGGALHYPPSLHLSTAVGAPAPGPPTYGGGPSSASAGMGSAGVHEVHTPNSSSPSEDVINPSNVAVLADCPGGAGLAHHTPIPVAGSQGEQENLNDWEQVVAMYMTGAGTRDGIPLKDYSKGDGHRVEDRKLLEKRRTIGKTFESLGKTRFEHAIGYRIEEGTGLKKKQKMYHVIARCRVVNSIRKAGGNLPEDPVELERLISYHIAQKNQSKSGDAAVGYEHSAQATLPQPAHQSTDVISQQAPYPRGPSDQSLQDHQFRHLQREHG